VRHDHPNEPESVLHGRVLGTIAPFRCEYSQPRATIIIPTHLTENPPKLLAIGDAPFKQPEIFTRRVHYNLYPGVPDPTPWEMFLAQNRTPPSISSEPDVVLRHLPPPPRAPAARSFLILATDSLSELYDGTPCVEMAADWAHCITEAASEALYAKGENLVLQLPRHALGGEDLISISQMVTLNMDTPWMDDMTIIVQAL
jgi:pyruvate dehydrogenase phosphatase